MLRTAVNEKDSSYWIFVTFSWLPWMLWSFMELYGPFFPKAEVLQIIDFSSFNFWKSPFHAWGIVILPELVKILWWLPTLTGCSLPSRGATVLGACSMARALHSDGSRFIIFAKPHSRPEKWVFEQRRAIFTKFGEIPHILWMAIAWPAEVQLTWVLFLWLANAQLMILGTGSASKVHSKPDLCTIENDWQNLPLLPQFWGKIDSYPLWTAIARPTEVQLTQVLFLQLENSQLMILGTGSASKVHSKPDL